MALWVPPRARPAWTCRICGKEFYENERVTREQHAGKCAAEHRELLMERQERAMPRSLTHSFDPEYEKWAKVNKRIG